MECLLLLLLKTTGHNVEQQIGRSFATQNQAVSAACLVRGWITSVHVQHELVSEHPNLEQVSSKAPRANTMGLIAMRYSSLKNDYKLKKLFIVISGMLIFQFLCFLNDLCPVTDHSSCFLVICSSRVFTQVQLQQKSMKLWKIVTSSLQPGRKCCFQEQFQQVMSACNMNNFMLESLL